VSRRSMRNVDPLKAQGHRSLINWLKGERCGDCQDVAIQLAGCRVGTWEKKHLPIYTTGNTLDYLGSTIPCDKHLCDLCGVEKAFKLRQRYMPLVEQTWPVGNHIHFVPTIRHESGDQWIDLINVLMFIWKKLYRLSWWKRAVLGFIRNDATIHNYNGFHVHQHNIITLRHDVDIIQFSENIKKHYITHAAKCGYTLEWRPDRGWWKHIEDQEGLYKVISYATNSVSWTEFDDGRGVMARSGAKAFVEVWTDCFRHRWHSSSGVWKRKAAATTLAPGRSATLGLPTRVWNGLSPAKRDAVRACVGLPNGVETLEVLLSEEGGLIRLD